MAEPPLNWADIWLLQAVRICAQNNAATSVEDILAAADGLNHAILTFEEFAGGVWRLKRAGLLEQTGKTLSPTRRGSDLFEKYKRQGVHRQAESLRREIGVDDWAEDYQPGAQPAGLDPFVSREQFDAAARNYSRSS